jgi:hypothetical protein
MVLDEANLRYVCTDTGMGVTGMVYDIIQVKDRGTPVLYTDNGDGTFDLTYSPDGAITADVVYYTSAPDQVCISDAMVHLVGDRGGLIATGNYAGPGVTFDVRPGTGIDAWLDAGGEDYSIGFVLSEKRNIIDLLTEKCNTGLCFWAMTRLNQFTFGRIRPNDIAALGVSPLASIAEADFKANTFKIDHADTAYYRLSSVVNKNWSTQSDLAGVLTPNERGILSRKGLQVIQNPTAGTGYNANPQLYNLSLVESPELDTLLSSSNDVSGDTRARHWMDTARAKQAPWIETVSGVFNIEYFELELGDPVTLQMNRYGYDAGPLTQVVGIDINLTEGEVGLRLCRRSTSSISAGAGTPLPPEEPVPLAIKDRGRSALRFEGSGSPPPPPTMWTIDVQTEDSTQMRVGPWVRFNGQQSGDENVIVIGNRVVTVGGSVFAYSGGSYNHIEDTFTVGGIVANYGVGKIVHCGDNGVGSEEATWRTISATGYDTILTNQLLGAPPFYVAASVTYTAFSGMSVTGGPAIYDADGNNFLFDIDSTVGGAQTQVNDSVAALFDNSTTGNVDLYVAGFDGLNIVLQQWEIIGGGPTFVSADVIYAPDNGPIFGYALDMVISENGQTLAIGGDMTTSAGKSNCGVFVYTRAGTGAPFSIPGGGSSSATYFLNDTDNGSHAGLGRSLALSRDGSKLLVGAPLSDKGIFGGGYSGRVFLVDTVTQAGVIDDDFTPLREFTHNHDALGTINSGYGVSVHMSGGTASTPTHFAIATSDAVGTNGKVDIWT